MSSIDICWQWPSARIYYSSDAASSMDMYPASLHHKSACASLFFPPASAAGATPLRIDSLSFPPLHAPRSPPIKYARLGYSVQSPAGVEQIWVTAMPASGGPLQFSLSFTQGHNALHCAQAFAATYEYLCRRASRAKSTESPAVLHDAGGKHLAQIPTDGSGGIQSTAYTKRSSSSSLIRAGERFRKKWASFCSRS